ncbi:MAG TPA: endonuclease/exonuclease/phosphatase family protein, partial [Fodinibius sp.]|nr:endonuclease/exonuclease/phosphatase family protein [Fodinibius sp.]
MNNPGYLLKWFFSIDYQKNQPFYGMILCLFLRIVIRLVACLQFMLLSIILKYVNSMLSVTSINLNGIRAAQRKGFSGWVKRTNPDILCLQELRALENQIPPEVTHLAYHSYYHTAVKKGYSGVGILSKQKPLSIQTGIGV